MAYPHTEIADFNVSVGVHGIFQYVADIEPIFFQLTLFIIFLIASFGSFFAQKEMTGRGNMKASLSVAGFMTTSVAYVMNLIPGIIDPLTIPVCLVVTVLFTILLFLPKER